MIQRIKERMRLGVICKIVPTIIFLLFVGLIMVKSLTGAVTNSLADTKFTPNSLFKLTDGFEAILQENIYRKYNFIELNGLTARLLGQNSLNERLRMANGVLKRFMSPVSMQTINGFADSTGELNRFLNERGIEFLYVLAPNKSTVYDAEYLPGYEEQCGQFTDEMIHALNEAGVDSIDINAWLMQHGVHSEDAFFKTDHHWKPEIALQAARLTMEYLEEKGISNYNRAWFSEEAWTVEVWEDHFLGSDGKRVGIPYAGMDDISIYRPNFPTEYQCANLAMYVSSWAYTNMLLNEDNKFRKDYYDYSPYTTYMFQDAPLRITKNNLGWNRQRILIMGDSFKLPYDYFMTTQFQEVYTVDLRYYRDGSFAQAVEEIQPDVVLMCVSSFAVNDIHEFGLESYNAALEQTREKGLQAIELKDFALKAQTGNDNQFAVVYTELEAGETYTLTVGNTEIHGGEDRFVQMSLYNLSTNEPICNHYFAASSDESQKWIFTVPDETTDTFAVYLYAGIRGYTANVCAKVRDIKLYNGIMTEASSDS